jgi:hypothetical protein
MKYICFGYSDEKAWENKSEAEWNGFFDRCFSYDDELRSKGNFLGGEALQESKNAVTIRWQGGQAVVTDGPFAETKEQIGGIMILEAMDLNHAIRLISQHPSLRLGSGPWEIRPAADLTEMIKESERRRGVPEASRV